MLKTCCASVFYLCITDFDECSCFLAAKTYDATGGAGNNQLIRPTYKPKLLATSILQP